MRRLLVALLLFLPLSGCVVYEHDHGGWRGGHRYYAPPPPPVRYAPAPGYYWHR
ncbi:hypothetical protein SAMN05216577_14618 [Pseudomonas citronellolis]|jgi:hypothetical protein|uniref:Uncharacterized protein n=1 Tax=Pseudomonas citronellolis TaxID=53408 RepID=A0AAQ1KNH0_9PSED|nr:MULTISPECIES: hypothetical protein [Pseudomonas]MBH3432744.1 hypothetical protein [Pseudomonas citronellolis]MCL6692622.1 hypothetical protein [Pseudomonas sp. R3.Fl]MCP1602975.1 hypothetical protein [Pseudomonas citronellolis]MCP1645068.1 hypothetical protein [Pseudomonas citronellolis]MCP1654033.1 hypothetical protein [Pseudomonas citronellolis]